MKKRISAALAAVMGLSVLFGAGCSMGLYKFERYDNADLYQVGDFTYAAANVKEIEIEWVAGEIEIVQSDKETLSVYESNPSEDDDKKLHYYLDGTTLKLQYCKSDYRIQVAEENKKLYVEVPANVALDIDSVSASVKLNDVTATAVAVETVSGNVTGNHWQCKDVEIETVSGKVAVADVAAETIEVETVSGDTALGLQGATVLDLSDVSGKVSLTLLSPYGANVQYETVSGRFETDRAYDNKNDDSYVIYASDGLSGMGYTIEVETVSGDLVIR